MKTYKGFKTNSKVKYKGFEITEGRNHYMIGNDEHGSITHDNAVPFTVNECKIVINEFLKGNLNPQL